MGIDGNTGHFVRNLSEDMECYIDGNTRHFLRALIEDMECCIDGNTGHFVRALSEDMECYIDGNNNSSSPGERPWSALYYVHSWEPRILRQCH